MSAPDRADDRVLRPLLVSPYGNVGGAQLVLTRIVEAMGTDFAPRGVVMQEGPFADMLRARGVPSKVVHLPGKAAVRRFRSAAREVERWLGDDHVSLVHANGIKAAAFGFPLARHLGVPLVWMKHDHATDGVRAIVIAVCCDRIICVSEAMRDAFPQWIRGKVSVVYPGADLPPIVEPIADELLIASVGRLDPAKGFDRVLHATALLRARGVDVRTVIAGPVDRVHCEHADELRALVAELGLKGHASVGWVDDLDALYARARVVVLASGGRRHGRPGEGAPIVLAEAMAHGRPVVARRESGIEEVVGDAGTLVDEPTIGGLVAAIESYLSDARVAAEVGARGRRRVEERFTIARTVEGLRAAYATVV